MNHEKEAFDGAGFFDLPDKVTRVAGFFDLLGEVTGHHDTGVVSARIHVRDGIPWAVSVQFDKAAERAA